MITTIAEHTVDLSLLPEKANILDLGCLNFEFTRYFRNKGHTVKAIDIQELDFVESYTMVAVSNFTGTAYIEYTTDKQAARIVKRKTPYEIHCVTLQELNRYFEIPFWDVIKMDIEASERDVIMSLDKAPAAQISVEFHCHTGVYGMDEVKIMEQKLYSLGYYAAQHEATKQHGAGLNFWDSLFILK